MVASLDESLDDSAASIMKRASTHNKFRQSLSEQKILESMVQENINEVSEHSSSSLTDELEDDYD